MLSSIALTVTVLISAAIFVIGSFYLVSPERVTPSFGLKLPSPDPNTRAWLRLKGIRDLASGLVVVSLLLFAGKHVAGIALLAFSVIAFGDMTIVLSSGGSRSAAFSIHGLTCAVMIAAGLVLLHAA